MNSLKRVVLALVAYGLMSVACPGSAAAQDMKRVEYHSRGSMDLYVNELPAESRLELEAEGIRCIIKDKAGEGGVLNSRPDFARIVEDGRDAGCRGESSCDPYIGSLFRKIREDFVSHHVKAYKDIVSGRVKGTVKIKKRPRIDFGEYFGMCNGAITVTATAEDGTEYKAIDCGRDGSTDYFSAKPPGESRTLRMVYDNSDFAVRHIGDLVQYALKHNEKGNILMQKAERLEEVFSH